jgi:hypothetical protein
MQHPEKIRLLTANRDLTTAQGLEIGPRDAPLVRKDTARVLYADYADAETIRANLHDPLIDKAAVVEVDVVTGGGSLAAVTPHKVDYIVASHVAEHVPDLIGWLQDLHKVLRPGGTLGLGIPDKRFTFDRFRPDSVIAEAVEAYLLHYERPSLRQIFDSAWQAIEMSVSQGWKGEIPASGQRPVRLSRLKPALDLIRGVQESGRYNDAHCWVFTPASFLDLIEEIACLDLLPYVLQRFVPTEPGGYEFFAVFRRAEAGQFEAIRQSITAARQVLAASQAEQDFAHAHEPAALRALRTENAALRDALATMRTSTSWRLTAPLRRLARRRG